MRLTATTTRLIALLLLAGGLSLSNVVPAQSTGGPVTEAPPRGAQVTINMNNADIRAVIQWIAEQTQKQVIIDPRVKGRITVLAERPMSIEQAYRVFLATLDVYGYAATETNGVLRIFPASMVKTSAKEVVQDFNKLGQARHVVHVLWLENVAAKDMAQLLRPLVDQNGQVLPLPDNNSLVLADDGENVQRLSELARLLDQTGDLDIDVITLDNASAENVAGVVESLIASQRNEQDSRLTVAVDERSNSLILSGNPKERKRVRKLAQQLDQPIAQTGNTRVIYLHYLDAEEILPILEGVVGSKQEEATSDTVSDAAISIQASKSANALVLTAPPSMLDDLEEVIQQLDIRRAQVLVEAIIVEVSQDFAMQLGVEWSTALTNDGTAAFTNFGLQPPVDAETGAPTAAVGDLLTGLTLGYFRNGSLRALLRAIASDKNANLLSTPSVMTLDNEEAEILVGSNIPVITGQSTSGAAGTDNPFTTFEREDIGVSLKITPHINQGDAITLDILQEVETVAPSSTVENDIVTDKRSIDTKVLIDDEAIVVLGGLISDETTEVVRKVPLLGDIPLLGALFRSTLEEKKKRNLMVFLHPTIVDSEAVAEEVSAERYDEIRTLQRRYLSGKFREIMSEQSELPEFSTYSPRQSAEPSKAAKDEHTKGDTATEE